MRLQRMWQTSAQLTLLHIAAACAQASSCQPLLVLSVNRCLCCSCSILQVGHVHTAACVRVHLACRYGITCVTLDGKKHSKGSLEGGYRAPQGLTFCAEKLAADSACAEQQSAAQAYDTSKRAVDRLQADLDAAQQQQARLGDLEQSLAALEAEAVALKRSLQTVEASKASAGRRCHELERMLAEHSSSSAGPGACPEDLEATQKRVRKQLAALQNDVLAKQHALQVSRSPSHAI
jgi:chromosome segregation ATPase